MSNLQTGKDLVDDALRKAGEKTDGTSDYQADALGYMNHIYKAILSGGNIFSKDMGEPWTWAKAKYPAVLTLLAPVTGSVALTQGSASGTFSSAPSISLVGRYLKTSSSPEYYRIITHLPSSTAFELDGPYNYASGTDSYKAIQVDYDLTAASILRQIGPMKVAQTQTSDGDQEGKIYGLDIRSFEKKNPLHAIMPGVPTEFAVLFTEENLVTVRFNKYISETATTPYIRVEYDYIPMPTEITYSLSMIPIIPNGYRDILSLGTAHFLCIDKEDSKADIYGKHAAAQCAALIGANRREFMQISKNRGRLIARMDDFGGRNWPTSGQ